MTSPLTAAFIAQQSGKCCFYLAFRRSVRSKCDFSSGSFFASTRSRNLVATAKFGPYFWFWQTLHNLGTQWSLGGRHRERTKPCNRDNNYVCIFRIAESSFFYHKMYPVEVLPIRWTGICRHSDIQHFQYRYKLSETWKFALLPTFRSSNRSLPSLNKNIIHVLKKKLFNESMRPALNKGRSLVRAARYSPQNPILKSRIHKIWIRTKNKIFCSGRIGKCPFRTIRSYWNRCLAPTQESM